jgi:hypothetical protein
MESLSLTRRTRQARLSSVGLVDTVSSDGWFGRAPTPLPLQSRLPLVDEGAEPPRSRGEAQSLGYSGPERTGVAQRTAPQPGFTFDGYV